MDADVPPDNLSELSQNVLAEIRRRSRVRCWGAMPGERNRLTWESMEPGDIGIGYTERYFRYLGTVYAKARSPITAHRIWGTPLGETVGLLYFFDPLESVEIGVGVVSDALGYKSTWHPQNFGFPADQRQALLRSRYGSVDGFVREFAALVPAAPSESVELFGTPYVRARTDVEKPEPDPDDYEPDRAGRGLNAHNDVQNRIADHIEASGGTPLKALATGRQWDIGWLRDGVRFVGEVKSLNATNEEGQLRRGLGQVLRYRQLACRTYRDVVAVLVVEREPAAMSDWLELCSSLGVTLTWPARFAMDIGRRAEAD